MSMRFIVSAVLVVASLAAHAEEPFEALRDDPTLGKAVLDVLKMEREELDAFAIYLASCTAAAGLSDGTAHFACTRDRVLYSARYMKERPLDKLIASRGEAASMARTREVFKLPQKTIDEVLGRIALFDADMLDAAAARSTQLRKRR